MPYPFYLASPIEMPVEELGERGEWMVEWKWDGIRAQLIKRGPDAALWSRGDELITERFPEILNAAAAVPVGTVIDGEIVVMSEGKVLPFQVLQRRIGRQKLASKVLKEAPAAFLAYDLLEHEGKDFRGVALVERRAALEGIVGTGSKRLVLSEVLGAASWDEIGAARATSRERGVEGVMIKRLTSPYGVGRVRGDWWKWKIEPYTLDAVLVYAQPGHGKRANLLTDYTFALWDNGELVPVAKAYSGLTNEEIGVLDSWIRAHTVERFGPARSVEPVQVFELAFEGIGLSDRHKSGIALRFPRISRWRTDKKAGDADTMETAREMLRARG
jgi:DNA ligase-1